MRDYTAKCLIAQVLTQTAARIRYCLGNRRVEAVFNFQGEVTIFCDFDSHFYHLKRGKTNGMLSL